MRTFLPTLLLAILYVTMTANTACHARTPCHVSTSPHAYQAPHAGHVYLVPAPMHGGFATPAAKPAYAYGWFGVKTRSHKSVHHGYYHNYTQWSHR